MKKISILSALAACTLALPLTAAVLNGTVDSATSGSVSRRNADVNTGNQVQGSGQSNGSNGSMNGSVNAQASHDGRNNSATMESTVNAEGNVDRAAQRRNLDRVHKNYRSYAKRLDKVENRLVEDGKKGKNWTNEQVQEQRERIQEIRAKLRNKGDKMGDKMSDAEKKSLDAEVTAEEQAVAKSDQE